MVVIRKYVSVANVCKVQLQRLLWTQSINTIVLDKHPIQFNYITISQAFPTKAQIGEHVVGFTHRNVLLFSHSRTAFVSLI